MDFKKKNFHQLNYKDDIILFEKSNMISLINPFQGRVHLIIREKPESEFNGPNNLSQFPRQLLDDFWYLLQQTVADLQAPSMLCHHFGNWRSAEHFHVHIIVNNNDFINYVIKKSTNLIDKNLIDSKFEKKMEFLVERQFGFKNEEIRIIKEKKPISNKEFLKEWKDFLIELHPFFSRVNFIPKKPLVYSNIKSEVIVQLNKNRESVLLAMTSFADYYGFKDFRTWQKLSGDCLHLNYQRPNHLHIFGVLQLYPPDYYSIHPNREEWFENWINSKNHSLNYQKIDFDPLSAI